MHAFSKQSVKLAREYVPMIFGLRIPGFIKVHMRYARRNLVTWLVLFLVPFVICVMSFATIGEKFFEVKTSSWQLNFLVLFLIALAFFFAERNRKFRRIYVMAIPVMVIVNGLFNLIFTGGLSVSSLVTFGILAALPAWWLGRHAMGKGYRLLSDGADKDYRPGRDLYMDGKYAESFVHLEPSAKRGHMKSLYLLGHSHEYGNGREIGRITAARFYDKAGRKGYGKAHIAFEKLFDTFSLEETKTFETNLGISEINELI